MEIERETPGRLQSGRSWCSNTTQDQDTKKVGDRDQFIKEPAWKRFLAHVGPGFMVSLAYLDPGNLETDLQAGANHRYELLWVILIGLIFALIIQSLAANLGVVTGRHLAEICKSEYPKFVMICLWLLAELAVIAADIPEVIGTAFALNLLFHIPVWVGVLITGSSTLLLLGLQRYGVRKLEFVVSMLVLVMAACFFGELSYVKPPAKEVIKGLFTPKLKGDGATADAIALIGALVMPNQREDPEIEPSNVNSPQSEAIGDVHDEGLHQMPETFEEGHRKPSGPGAVSTFMLARTASIFSPEKAIMRLSFYRNRHNLFLHSALVLSRKTPASVRGIKDACRFFLYESGFALFIALLINIAVISVSGTVCFRENLSADDADKCSDLSLDNSSFLLKNVLGKSSAIVYGVALLASGQSSTITGTYAGQYIMQGFLDIKMKTWMRNLMTRCIAIFPSLVVSIIGGSNGAGRLIIIASMILSFELPFALIPLLKFSSSSSKLGPHKNSIYIIVFSWVLGLLLIGINVYFLSTSFVGWLIHNSLPKYANVLVGIVVFPLMLIYIVAVIYLTLRKDTVVTFVADSCKTDAEKAVDGSYDDEPVPYREDLADIPLPAHGRSD